jgi:hypothetical protein
MFFTSDSRITIPRGEMGQARSKYISFAFRGLIEFSLLSGLDKDFVFAG